MQTAARAARAAGGPAFAPGEAASRGAVVAGPASMPVALVIGALELPDERRRRALRHGRKLLDALDALHVAALGGGNATDAASRLANEAREKVEDGDVALAGLIAQIRIRAEVELAKGEVVRLSKRRSA